jgi:hypothetical protein
MYNVPVLMYHSIGVTNKSWNWNYLTCPYDRFESQLKAIQELKYKTITLNALYDYMVLGKTIPEKSIVLTFDDGYADIWVYAYPLLKKYKMCGTVFINPEFVDPRSKVNDLFKLNDKTDHLVKSGYLSWKEIIQMDKERVIFSESHALTHTWYPISNEIIDFRKPNDPFIWMSWNENTKIKYKLQLDNYSLRKLGQPVYKYEKSLMHRRYFPDPELDAFLINYVSNNGQELFFKKSNYKGILHKEAKKFIKKHCFQEYYETQKEYEVRIKFELLSTKKILEEKLDREITFLCWPGGSATKIGIKIAKESGYKFFNSARDMSFQERKNVRNIKKGGNRVNRITPKIYFNNKENFNSKIIYANKFWMKLFLYRSTNSLISKIIFKGASELSKVYYNLL